MWRSGKQLKFRIKCVFWESGGPCTQQPANSFEWGTKNQFRFQFHSSSLACSATRKLTLRKYEKNKTCKQDALRHRHHRQFHNCRQMCVFLASRIVRMLQMIGVVVPSSPSLPVTMHNSIYLHLPHHVRHLLSARSQIGLMWNNECKESMLSHMNNARELRNEEWWICDATDSTSIAPFQLGDCTLRSNNIVQLSSQSDKTWAMTLWCLSVQLFQRSANYNCMDIRR